MTNRKPSWPLWCAAAVILPALYFASFGPACWLARRTNYQGIAAAYRPIFWIWAHGPSPVGKCIIWYGNLGIPGRYLFREGDALDWVAW